MISIRRISLFDHVMAMLVKLSLKEKSIEYLEFGLTKSRIQIIVSQLIHWSHSSIQSKNIENHIWMNQLH